MNKTNNGANNPVEMGNEYNNEWNARDYTPALPPAKAPKAPTPVAPTEPVPDHIAALMAMWTGTKTTK